MNEDGERLAVLDGLRSLAIALVMARHSLRPFWTDLGQPFIGNTVFDPAVFLLNGWVGVDLFFVLSGFLITRRLLRENPEQKAGRKKVIFNYMWQRFFRIAPAYYLVLTLLCLGLFPSYPSTEPMTAWRYVYHLLFLNDYWPSDICVVFWSLAIEMKFYLIAPFIIIGILRWPKSWHRMVLPVCLVGFVILARVATATMVPFDDSYNAYFVHIRNKFHLTLDGLLLGMACAFALHDSVLRRFLFRPRVGSALFISGLMIFLMLTVFQPLIDTGTSFLDRTFLPTMIAGSFAMMMLGLVCGGVGHTVFGHKIFSGPAKLAFTLYLVHMPILAIATNLTSGIGGSVQLHWLMTLPVFILMSVAASVALHIFVEKPFIAWSKKTTGEASVPHA